MESNHTFNTEQLAANDENFKPFTGELPTRFKILNERANMRYQNMLPSTIIKLRGALTCLNSAVLRTAYSLDIKNNKLDPTDARVQEEFEAINDPIFKLKHAA